MSVAAATENNEDLEIYKIIANCPENLEAKMIIAKNVLESLSVTKSRTEEKDIIKQIHQLTGVDEASFKDIYSSWTMVKQFSYYIHEKNLRKLHSSCITFENLRDIITRMYTKELTVATMPKLLGIINRIYTTYNVSKLRNELKQHGFTWKRLPGTNKSLLVENTCQFMNRIAYLTKIRSYRQEGRYFAYLDVGLNGCVAASGSLGLINVNSLYNKKDSETVNFHRWLEHVLVLLLPPRCVLVAAESGRDQYIVIPTCNSTKADMCKWLEKNSISYDLQATKAELFSLVKTYEQVCPKAKCYTEELLKYHGHEIMWRPTALPVLDYFSRIIINSTESTTVDVTELTSDNWRDYEKDLINKENQIYAEDLEVETIVDKLLTLAKYGELSNKDLDGCDEILADDKYISRIIQ